MVAFPEKPGNERREGPYSEQNPQGNPKGSGGADQDHGKGALGGPNEGEEGEIYLENHPTKANGYYTRDLLTLVSPLKDLIVPLRTGMQFPSLDPPYRASRKQSIGFGSAR